MKAEIIHKKVTEMADFIKECNANGQIPFIVQKRSWGKRLATRLANSTQDISHEEIKPLMIEAEKVKECDTTMLKKEPMSGQKPNHP